LLCMLMNPAPDTLLALSRDVMGHVGMYLPRMDLLTLSITSHTCRKLFAELMPIILTGRPVCGID
jgi:hypothetical protein